MILEVAEVFVKEGTGADFEAGIRESTAKYISQSAGYRRSELQRGIEDPTRYLLLIEWESVEAHLQFRESDDFPRHRALIGEYFAKPPFVEHFELVSLEVDNT